MSALPRAAPSARAGCATNKAAASATQGRHVVSKALKSLGFTAFSLVAARFVAATYAPASATTRFVAGGLNRREIGLELRHPSGTDTCRVIP